MIRSKYQKDIITTIDNHKRFESSDFEIKSTKDSRGAITLTIKYLVELKYSIVFKMPSSKTRDKDGYSDYYKFTGTVCPGPLAYSESFTFSGIDGLYSRITEWLDCIWEELLSNPIVKRIEDQQSEINKIVENFDNLGDEYFSLEEAEDLKGRLDKLEKDLKEQIEKNSKDKKKTESEIKELQNDIDTLKQTVESFKKKSWLKGFTGKVFKWTRSSKNRKMLKDGYNVVREFLPEDIKSSLPELPE